MDTQDFFLQIFMEHVGSASIFPFLSSLTLEVMKLFGGYDVQSAAYVGIAGLITGSFLNWIIGYLLSLVREKVTFLGKDDFEKPSRFFNRYGFVLAGFFWLPLGSILVLVMGFFRVSLLKIIPVVVLGALWHLHEYII
jgi:membrane protein YqaA with SNARE-associated domain